MRAGGKNPITRRTTIVLAAAAVFMLLWWTAGEASRAESRRRFAVSLVPDVLPARPLDLHGDVRVVELRGDVERTDDRKLAPGEKREFRAVCDSMCAALLALPEVDSVSIARGPKEKFTTRFRLVPKAECHEPSVIPSNPDGLRSSLPQSGQRSRENDTRNSIAEALALETAWRIRLSTQDCIVADETDTAPTLTIRQRSLDYPREQKWGFEWAWTFQPLPVSTRRVEVVDGGGSVLFRRSFTATRILGRPILPGIVGSKGSHIQLPVFGWRRDHLRNFSSDQEFHGPSFLLANTNLREGLDFAGQADAISDELRRVLDDPTIPASDPVFALTDTWMRSLTAKSITNADKALIVDLVEDRRVTAFQGIWDAVRALGPEATILADPIRKRIALDYDRWSVMRPLSAQLSAVSAPALGPSSEELAILSDPEKRLNADGVIIRQADYGAKSVPLLMRIMREHVARAQNSRELNPIDAVMVALCRIGPDAKAAIPELRALRSSWLSKHLSEDRYWQFTLARIGTPLHEILPPEGLNMDQSRYADHLRYRLNDFNPQRDCKESWV